MPRSLASVGDIREATKGLPDDAPIVAIDIEGVAWKVSFVHQDDRDRSDPALESDWGRPSAPCLVVLLG